MSELENLYQEVIMRHNDSPQNYYKPESAAFSLDAYNQFCGDHFQIYFDIEDGKIKNACFQGYGCAISKASTSILVEQIEGKTIEEAKQLYESFIAAIQEEPQPQSGIIPKEFLAFQPVQKFPGRKKCATLSWDELSLFLKKSQ